MSFQFETATPVKPAKGRTAEPNPFTDAVKSIALKIDEETGEPAALKFTIDTPPTDKGNPDLIKFNRMIRQLQNAGDLCTPQVSVHKHIGPAVKEIKRGGKVVSTEEIPGKSTVTFWTTEKIRKETKTATQETTPDTGAEVPATDPADVPQPAFSG